MCGHCDQAQQPPGGSPGARVLRRNISNSSSNVANNHLEAGLSRGKHATSGILHDQPDDRTTHTDTEWGGDSCSMDDLGHSGLLGSCLALLEPAEPSFPPSQLLLGTSAGVFLVNLQTQNIQLLGLQDSIVGQISYANGIVLASCPVMDTSLQHQQHHAAAALAGLYSIDINSSHSNPLAQAPACVHKLWEGNARCTAILAPSSISEPTTAVPRIYLGTQPADVLYSDNFGASWVSSGLSEGPARKQWYHRSPPYEPSVRSISCCALSHISHGSSGSGYESQGMACAQEHPELLVGVEVGGVYTCSHQDQAAPEGGDSSDSNSSCSPWSESSQGLCKDVQSVQRDPWSSKRLYAVAGSGSLPGGVYRSRGWGQKWKRLFGYRYSAGMALSSYQKGRLLLLSADKPPDVGSYIFESLDGGRHWANITDDIHEALLLLTDHAHGLFDHTPVCMFVPGGLVVACATGHVFHGQAVANGGYTGWRLLCQVPAAVNCLCLTDASVTPVGISRM